MIQFSSPKYDPESRLRPKGSKRLFCFSQSAYFKQLINGLCCPVCCPFLPLSAPPQDISSRPLCCLPMLPPVPDSRHPRHSHRDGVGICAVVQGFSLRLYNCYGNTPPMARKVKVRASFSSFLTELKPRNLVLLRRHFAMMTSSVAGVENAVLESMLTLPLSAADRRKFHSYRTDSGESACRCWVRRWSNGGLAWRRIPRSRFRKTGVRKEPPPAF